MNLSSTQAFLQEMDRRFPLVFASILCKHPDLYDPKHRNVADVVLIDLFQVFNYEVNALEVPEAYRHHFIPLTFEEQRQHLNSFGIFPKLLERFSQHIEAHHRQPNMEVLYRLGYPKIEADRLGKPTKERIEASPYPDFASW